MTAQSQGDLKVPECEAQGGLQERRGEERSARGAQAGSRSRGFGRGAESEDWRREAGL